MKCVRCIATAVDEEGEVFRCPCCGFVFRFTEK